jgi:ABC-type transport system involved in cytochrome bd biosynthesis fused ATPase/permease subunit
LAEHVEELMACGGEPAWREHIEEAASRLDRLELAQARSTAFVPAVAAAAPALATAGVVAATGPAGPSVSGPVLGVLVLLPLAVLELVRPLATTGDMLAGVAAAAGRVQAVLQRPDPVAEPRVPAAAPDRGDLALEDVSLAWPGSLPQVAGIDLVVAEGTRVAITGPSGSGKSTVAAGLVRFLEPVVGDYSVGGCPAEALGGDGVRRLVTWCQQEPWFADTTLADNLRIAMPTAADEQLWTVLRTVHLDEWARRLPSGLATPLSRDADAMSGGERQRLSLARALLGGQRAMVLDEPTAHLDHETGKAVMDDLLAATFDRAVVLITHDPRVAGIDRHHRLAPQRSGPSIWGERTELPTPPGIDDHHLG